MPQYQQSISVSGLDKETILAICYSSFKQLNWEVLYAGEEKLLGASPKTWKANSQQIMATAADGQLEVSSEMTQGEAFDLGGKNKKNVTDFLTAFENCSKTTEPATIAQNHMALEELRTKTLQVAEQEQKDAAEIDAAMNLSTGNLYVTYSIMGINILVFIAMAINGAGIFEANGLVHMKWGSNFGPLTLSGDWWRLITNVFIHFGIIHLAMNMYCLYTVGVYLEPMLGKIKYTAAYLCTGVLASVVSLWWHDDPVSSAGASGAIFGMYGLFLALLTTNLIPKQIRQPLLQSIGVFVVYNLLYGMKGGVDNAAHVGGLLSGFIIGYIYVIGIKKEKQEQNAAWIAPAVILLTLGIAFTYLQQHNADAAQRTAILNELTAEGYKDNEKFVEKMNALSEKEDAAISALKGADSISREEFVIRLDKAIPLWEEAEVIIKSTENYNISAESHQKAQKLLAYVQLRQKQFSLLSVVNKSTEENVQNKELEETNEKISKILTELNASQ